MNQAVERGVTFLFHTQLPSGSWSVTDSDKYGVGPGQQGTWAVGYAALPGLALLESGVPKEHASIQRAARFVRTNIQKQTRTYEISLAILFLERLSDRKDVPLIRSLALRLATGQYPTGGWGYHCPLLKQAQEKKVRELLQEKAKSLSRIGRERSRGKLIRETKTDNSNTQFAILGLWAARRHDLPLDWTFAAIERRFRMSQMKSGWSYGYGASAASARGGMTCVGLLGLAVGRGTASESDELQVEDAGFTEGLRALGRYLNDPTDKEGAIKESPWGPTEAPNLYFLWSVERVGVLCSLPTIGGRDWYRWCIQLLVPTQRRNGSWMGRGFGTPIVDTSFALLCLKRSDLMPDLRKELPKRIKITDPWLSKQPNAGKKKQPGKTPTLPKGIDTSPGEKTQPERPLEAALGDVKAGKATKLALRVRGPAPFRITGVRGGDDRLSVTHDALRKDVHELTLTLRPARAGAFTRTLVLRTDLPGRAEVSVVVRARAAP